MVRLSLQPVEQADELRELADRVQRLTVSRRDPERFHLDKSEIAHDLRRLAKAVAHG